MGSSNSIISGFIANALAIATLCFWPPDNEAGIASYLSAKPTVSSKFLATNSACSFSNFPSSTGAKVIFSPTVKLLNRLKCWKTIPIFSRALSISVLGSLISCPSMIIDPLVGSSNLFRHLNNVLFPEPDGPIKTTTSLFFTLKLIPFNTWLLP